jgi:hypothetical protein
MRVDVSGNHHVIGCDDDDDDDNNNNNATIFMLSDCTVNVK